MSENLPSPSMKVLGTTPIDTFSITLRQQLRVLWRRRLLVLSVAGVAMACTWILLKQITPIYSGTASVMIDNRKTRVLDLKEVITTSQPQLTTVMSEVEVIQSRNVAERVAKALNLYNDPEFNPTLLPPPTGLRAWIADGRKWLSSLTSTPMPEPTAEEKEKAVQAGVVSALLGATSASPVPQSMVINVSVRSRDAAKAALLTNTVTEQYVLDQLNSKFEATRSASAWLSARLEDLRNSVAESERAVAQYKANTGLIDSKGMLPTQQQLAELNSQLIQTQGRRAELQAKVARLETITRGGGGGVDEMIDSGLIQRLREQETTLLREISDMATRYGDKHPKMIKGNAELAELRSKINLEMSKVNQGVRNEYGVVRAREQALEDRIKQLEATIVGQNRSEVKLRELEREAQATRTLYENFLNRFKETSEQEQVQQPDARIISKAVRPGAPAFPRKGLIMVGMTAIGLLIGTLLALLLERLENTFRSREDLESIIGLPAIGMIPYIEKKPVVNYMLERPTSAFAEALRGLWVGLSQTDGEVPQVLAITSSFPSEGKSLTALSLARTVAQLGKRVVLVDCDLRRSAVAGLLNVRPAFSLEDVLTGRVTADSAMMIDEKTPLSILPARNMDRAPLDLLNSVAMEDLLASLRRQYDLVVLDCPPVIPVAEAQVLGRMADKTVFCVLWDKTPREAVGTAVRQLRDVRVDLAGALLTQVHLKKQSRYGYGDIGHYYGRYKGYYAD